MNKENTHLVWVGLSFLAVGLTLGLFFSGALAGNSVAGSADTLGAADDTEETFEFVAVSEDDDAVLGDPDAPVTIVEFSDFQCPYCARFVDQTLPTIKENYIDKGLVKLIYRDFPLGSHVDAGTAAEVAECVGEYGDDAYYEAHDAIFERTSEWSYNEDAEEVLLSIASDLGYDVTSCVQNGEMTEEVAADYAAARSYGVSGTPTLFVNGKKVVGAYPYAVFQELIEEELANN